MDRSGGNPFFKSVNMGYGESWQASQGVNPLQMQETPEYRDLVSFLKNCYFQINQLSSY